MRIIQLGIVTMLFIFSAYNLEAQIPFERTETNTGLLGLSISNYGTLGKPDARNNPQAGNSMRYAINSGMEHLFEAGIWIGIQSDGGQTFVSSSAITNSSGYSRGKSGFEFTADREIRFQG